MELSEYSLEALREDQEFVLYRCHAREAKGSSVLMLAASLNTARARNSQENEARMLVRE